MTSKLERIKRMEKDLAELKKQVVNENCGIDCHVEIYEIASDCSLGIPFQNNKAVLYYSKTDKIYKNRELSWGSKIKTKLHKINKNEIKKGDVVFRSDIENPDLEKKYKYCICLEDRVEKYCYVSDDEDVRISRITWDNYWIVKEDK